MQSNILTGYALKNIPGKVMSDYLVQKQTK